MGVTAYDGLYSLLVFTVFLLPAVIAGIFGRQLRWYGILISVPMLYMLCVGRLKQFLIFFVVELLLVYVYFKLKERFTSNYLYYGVFVISILPVFYVKVQPYTHWNSIAFMGISYMGFRIWQLIMEIHDGHIKEFKWLDILYFVSFFPALQSGPIDRYQRFVDDISVEADAEKYKSEFLRPGLKKIALGIAYKFALANFINAFCLLKIPTEVTLLHSVEYMYAYTLYLFFDFAGYSCMAIGTAYLLGVRAPENFNLPFLAKNMKEFWERWHISLSKWFGDYLFSRVVLNLIRNKWVKKQATATRIGYMVTMLTMGIWHGFTLYYIVYGLYQGLALVLTDIYLKSKFYRGFMKTPHFKLVSRLVCFHVIAFGLLIFSGYLIKI